MCGHVNICVCVFLSRSAQDKFLFSVMAYANGDRQIDFRDSDVDLQGHFPLVSVHGLLLLHMYTDITPTN